MLLNCGIGHRNWNLNKKSKRICTPRATLHDKIKIMSTIIANVLKIEKAEMEFGKSQLIRINCQVHDYKQIHKQIK